MPDEYNGSSYFTVFVQNEICIAFITADMRTDKFRRISSVAAEGISPKSTTSEYLREAFTAHNLKLLPEVELNSNDLLLDLARIGLGIACVPDYMLKENDQLTPLMLKEPLPGRQLILAQHDSLTVSQAAERFIEMFTSI